MKGYAYKNHNSGPSFNLNGESKTTTTIWAQFEASSIFIELVSDFLLSLVNENSPESTSWAQFKE